MGVNFAFPPRRFFVLTAGQNTEQTTHKQSSWLLGRTATGKVMATFSTLTLQASHMVLRTNTHYKLQSY